MVVGWYHSHPGFGCWLSGVDINTQQSFEALSERAVAVVVDPIQSVKGKVKMCHCCNALHIRIFVFPHMNTEWIIVFGFIFFVLLLSFFQVVIDAFRLINANMMVLGHEPRQTTSNLGHLNKPSIQVRWPGKRLVWKWIVSEITENYFMVIFFIKKKKT